MNYWQTIEKTALLGIDRVGLSPSIKELLKENGLENIGKNLAEEFLIANVLCSNLIRTGYQTEKLASELSPSAEEETKTVCKEQATNYLNRILKEIDFQPFLKEFLILTAENSRVLPAEILPELLQFTSSRREYHALVVKVLGKKGQWLVQQHPEWKKLILPLPELIWDEGNAAERMEYLRQLRAEDASRARELVAKSWATETAQAKATILEILTADFSTADEAFLEGCLRDGRKEVRQLASRLLAQLEGSALSRRMFERLKPFLRVEKHLLHQKLVVELPEKYDDELARDGIDVKGGWYQGGTKAKQFGQIFAMIPLAWWENSLKISAEKFLRLAMESEWGELLLQASVESARLHKDEKWLNLLLSEWVKSYQKPIWHNVQLDNLLHSLSAETFNSVVLKALESEHRLPSESHPATILLRTCEVNWSPDVTLALVKHLQTFLADANVRYWEGWYFKTILKQGARRSNPALWQRLEKGWNTKTALWGSWEKEITSFVEQLRFRHEFAEALKR